MSSKPTFRAGMIALFGKPNAGKSTLLNAIVGTRLAAVSALPQTTRERLHGIFSDDNRQLVFIDLPGLAAPSDRLNECLRQNLLEGLEGVDAVVHLVDVNDTEPYTPDVQAVLAAITVPVVLVLNKLDGKRARTNIGSWCGEVVPPEVAARYAHTVGVSAKESLQLPALLDLLTTYLSGDMPLYDPEQLTDRDLRYLSQEAIREKVFLYLHEELPYSVAVEIDEFSERERGKWYIRATIHVERDSQKGIVIGRGGEMLRKISAAARVEIEKLTEEAVFLDLWVKTRDKWRKNDNDLRMFGFKPPKPPKSSKPPKR
jgi:GTP-binding protein Era